MNQVEWISRAGRTVLLVFGIASLIAVGLGAAVMARADIPLGIWIRNPIAWFVAGALAIFLARLGWLGSWLAPVAVIVVALSLFGPGQEGVHRWLDLGLVLPAAIVAFDRASSTVTIPCFVLIAGLLAWQPDISQLAGFSLAATVLATTLRYGKLMLGAWVMLAAAAIAVCLTRPDPLAPVAHVEGIFTLAWSESPVLALGMGASLAVAALSPLIVWSSHPLGLIAPLGLAIYFATTGAAFLFGAYPVPLAGYGLSFVIGWWLGIAALCVRRAG